MKTRKMNVPRSIVKRHMPHPEYFGESIVELANGMVTDVYSEEDCLLYTMTNNESLIEYLSLQKKDHETTVIQILSYTLKAITADDLKMIHEWFLISPFRRAQSVDNDMSIVYEYISHAKSIFSDVFLLSKNTVNLGLLGFTIVHDVAILYCDLYTHSATNTIEMNLLIEEFIKYLSKLFHITKIALRIFEYDNFMLKVMEEEILHITNRTTILIPTMSGALLSYEYEIVI